MLKEPGRYIDPLTDFGFKHLFGREQNKDIMISFLNTLFEGSKHIDDIVYSPTEYSGGNDNYKKVFFDSMCTSEDGSQFIIEMQRNAQRHFRDRCIYYQSKLINEQEIKGKLHHHEGLKQVYLIGILDFRFGDSPEDDYYHEIGLQNHHSGNIFYDKLGYKFLELPNFKKEESELLTDLDKWFYLLKHMHHLNEIPASMDKPVFQKIFKISELANLTKEERMFFNANSKAQWDYEQSIIYAADQAEIKGNTKGKIEGALAVAVKLKEMGLPAEKIAEATQLSMEQIKNLGIAV